MCLEDAYPISTFTWLLLYKTYADQTKWNALKDFVNFGLTDGQKFSNDLGYIPLPKPVADKGLETLKGVK
jgi:phosphate transport system substrate-binding protein